MVRSCWEVRVSAVPREARPAPLLSRFAIAFIAVAISSCVSSIPRALPTGCCGSLFDMSGSSKSDLKPSSERKNRTHLSRKRPLSRSSLPPSSRTHCDSTFFVFSSCTDLMFWKIHADLPCATVLQLNDVALEKTNDCCTSHFLQPAICFPNAVRSCASLVSVVRRCHDACIASVAVCSSASVWASPLKPRPCLLRSWGGITNSAVPMMAAANVASTSSTLLSLGGFTLRRLPTAVATSCRSRGSVTRRLRSPGGLAGTLNRRFREKRPRSLTGADTMLWSEMERKEGWGCAVTFRTNLRSRWLM